MLTPACLRAAHTAVPNVIAVATVVSSAAVIAIGLAYDALSRKFLRGVLRDYVRSQEGRL